MSAAELIHRASEAGVELVVMQNGRLQLSAVRQPSVDLLAELTTLKIEIITALNAATDPLRSSVWLADVAHLLNTCPGILLEEGHLEQHDLIELTGTDPALVADIIRTNPAWINRSREVEQSPKAHAMEEFKPQRTVYTAATASQAWREASDAYTNHLMSCGECYAPMSRYCAVGDDLCQLYDHTPMEASA